MSENRYGFEDKTGPITRESLNSLIEEIDREMVKIMNAVIVLKRDSPEGSEEKEAALMAEWHDLYKRNQANERLMAVKDKHGW